MKSFWSMEGRKRWVPDRPGYFFLARGIERLELQTFNMQPPASTCLKFAALADEGKLETAFRRRSDGIMRELPSHWWAADWVVHWFSSCNFMPFNPFLPSHPVTEMADIFVSIRSVEKVLGQVLVKPEEPKNSVEDQHLSPYLRLMLSIARDLSITPDSQPTIKTIRDMVKHRWGELPRSDSLMGAMCTMLHEPSSQLGRAKK